MKVSARMESALNNQINAEMFSAYLYQAMSASLKEGNLEGMSAWMAKQAKEEMEHAFKIYDYLFDRGNRPTLMAIKGPQTEWNSPLEIFEEALNHEVLVTGMINDLVALAQEEKDHATLQMLQWFVNEQVEEEDTAAKNIYLVKLAEAPYQLYQVDKEFAARSEE